MSCGDQRRQFSAPYDSERPAYDPYNPMFGTAVDYDAYLGYLCKPPDDIEADASNLQLPSTNRSRGRAPAIAPLLSTPDSSYNRPRTRTPSPSRRFDGRPHSPSGSASRPVSPTSAFCPASPTSVPPPNRPTRRPSPSLDHSSSSRDAPPTRARPIPPYSVLPPYSNSSAHPSTSTPLHRHWRQISASSSPIQEHKIASPTRPSGAAVIPPPSNASSGRPSAYQTSARTPGGSANYPSLPPVTSSSRRAGSAESSVNVTRTLAHPPSARFVASSSLGSESTRPSLPPGTTRPSFGSQSSRPSIASHSTHHSAAPSRTNTPIPLQPRGSFQNLQSTASSMKAAPPSVRRRNTLEVSQLNPATGLDRLDRDAEGYFLYGPRPESPQLIPSITSAQNEGNRHHFRSYFDRYTGYNANSTQPTTVSNTPMATRHPAQGIPGRAASPNRLEVPPNFRFSPREDLRSQAESRVQSPSPARWLSKISPRRSSSAPPRATPSRRGPSTSLGHKWQNIAEQAVQTDSDCDDRSSEFEKGFD